MCDRIPREETYREWLVSLLLFLAAPGEFWELQDEGRIAYKGDALLHLAPEEGGNYSLIYCDNIVATVCIDNERMIGRRVVVNSSWSDFFPYIGEERIVGMHIKPEFC